MYLQTIYAELDWKKTSSFYIAIAEIKIGSDNFGLGWMLPTTKTFSL